MRASTILAILVPIVAVVGQTPSATSSGTAALPTSTAGLSVCVITCSTAAATTAGCSSITDFACVCTSEAFQNAAGTCIQSTCTPEEYAQSVALSQQTCAAYQNTTSSLSAGVSSAIASVSSQASAAVTSIKAAASSQATAAASSIRSSVSAAATSKSAAGAPVALPGAGVAIAVGAVFLAVVAGPLALFA